MARARHLLLGWLLITAARAWAADAVMYYPDWFPGAQFAGVYVALDRGFYREAGLEVSLVPFAYGQKTAQLIDAQPAVCGIASIEGYIFLQRRAQGQDLKAFGAMFQQGPAGFMSLRKTGVTHVSDFAGKTIGVHKFADPLYRWFIQKGELPETAAKMVFVDDDITRLTRGEVDVMQGFAIAEFVHLRALAGDDARFLPFSELGFDSYSQLVITTAPQLARHRATLAKFLSATRRGWAEALAHPAAAIPAIHAEVGPTCDDAFQLASLLTLPEFVSPHHTAPLAPMSPEKWQRLEAACVEIGFLKTPEPVENFLVEVEKK
jgi:ABC-type nitrate/sulfonate/bicarbonate transport system substrate-binding protein